MKTEDLLIEAKEFFGYYKKEIGKFAKKGKKAVTVSFKEIAGQYPSLSDHLLRNPEEILQILELALDELGLIIGARVRLTDMPISVFVRIRDIRAKHLNQLITIDGIVRQASDVRPQVVNAKFECPSCGTTLSVLQIDRKFQEPSRCSCGRKGGFRQIGKDMVDAQRLVVEESPESLTGGEQSRRISVFLKEDLVEPKMEEKTTPGSRVKVHGVLKEVPIPLPTGAISTRFDLAIEANNILPMEEAFEDLALDDEDEKQIRELAADPNVFDKLAKTVAPSVYGYDEVKKALLLQLFGGIRKERSDRTFARGDMHVLLVGDPGVAKSVMLKFIASIAPKGRYVAGKSTTGAGLTATVVRDEFMRGWSLEAGAMVLSNRGIVCIDEIEKMEENDRSAMHEAMEQQTVTISKASVQATLRAETSVLAAGNPKFGRFDPYQPIATQIDIPPTLINRFDVIFIMRDLPERVKDEAIATHVLLEHRKAAEKQSIEPELVRKYIAYSKQNIKPELTEEAVDEIKKFYVDLRNKPIVTDQAMPPVPITARQLDALIRLSEASARVRLSKKVKKEDAKVAIEMMKYYLMQVGFDWKTQQFDIDRIATGIPSSKRNKIILVREALTRLESRLGKLIPYDELLKELGDKLDEDSMNEAVDELHRVGDVFIPRKGYIQKL
ncbi:MAG: minichromosome maintenance protein MCM [archaeon]